MRSLRRNEQMTSKERVLTTFAHKQPDRVPIGYSANGNIDRRLCEALDVKDGEWVGEALGVYFRQVDAHYRGRKLHNDVKDRYVEGLWGIHMRWVEHPSGGYWDYCDFPLRDADIDTIAKWPMPDPDDFDYASVVDACTRAAPFAIHAGHASMGDIINVTSMLRTMEQVLVDLITDDPAGLLLIDRRIDIMMPGGGYCFAPTHALQDNSPTENVLAMYEAAHTCGRY